MNGHNCYKYNPIKVCRFFVFSNINIFYVTKLFAKAQSLKKISPQTNEVMVAILSASFYWFYPAGMDHDKNRQCSETFTTTSPLSFSHLLYFPWFILWFCQSLSFWTLDYVGWSESTLRTRYKNHLYLFFFFPQGSTNLCSSISHKHSHTHIEIHTDTCKPNVTRPQQHSQMSSDRTTLDQPCES